MTHGAEEIYVPVPSRQCTGSGKDKNWEHKMKRKNGNKKKEVIILTIHTFIYKGMVITERQKGRVREKFRISMSYLCCPFYEAVGLRRDT